MLQLLKNVGRQNARELYGVRTFQQKRKSPVLHILYRTILCSDQRRGDQRHTFFVPPSTALLHSFCVTANEKDKEMNIEEVSRPIAAEARPAPSLPFPFLTNANTPGERKKGRNIDSFKAHTVRTLAPLTIIFNTFLCFFLVDMVCMGFTGYFLVGASYPLPFSQFDFGRRGMEGAFQTMIPVLFFFSSATAFSS